MTLHEAFVLLEAAGVHSVSVEFEVSEGELEVHPADFYNIDSELIDPLLADEVLETLEEPVHQRYSDTVLDFNVIDGILDWDIPSRKGTLSGEESEIVWNEFEEEIQI